jgi:hypothetical protein
VFCAGDSAEIVANFPAVADALWTDATPDERRELLERLHDD